MPKYNVCVAIQCDTGFEIEADSPEQAAEMADDILDRLRRQAEGG